MINLENIVNSAMDAAEKANRVVEGDYIGENGLWYCGKCHTPKQVKIELLGEIKTPFCMCDCEQKKKEAEEAEKRKIKEEERIKELRKTAFYEKPMQQWNFANDDLANEKITKAMQRYVDNFAELRKAGKGLLLYGSTGTGKTYAACEVANALIDKGYSVKVTNFARVLNMLQGTFEKQEYLDELNRYSLLVIDDLGIERDTAFAKEQVYNVIDARYRSGKPMIITTNLSMDKIKSPDDIENRRIYDRIIERCFPIEISGVSRRRKAVSRDYEDMKNLLGL